jgi:glyoxylase-like metal-dependent hydrolase (beta-lactamase superfamily II)
MIVERSMHPGWLSNAYLVADAPGGIAVFVDTGAPLEPLLAAVEEHGLTVTHVLRTHGHPDHVAGEGEVVRRYDAAVVTGELETGGLSVEAIPSPGHSDDGVSFLVNGELLFSGDTLFRDAVGGGPADQVRDSVLRLTALPPETRVLPGHTDETTIGREREHNPFVLYWEGRAAALDEPVQVGGAPATLLVWSPDYDGKGKALVRSADGAERIVGGSRVERGGGT